VKQDEVDQLKPACSPMQTPYRRCWLKLLSKMLLLCLIGADVKRKIIYFVSVLGGSCIGKLLDDEFIR